MIKMGSLFAGIGGFEKGAEMAFDEAGIPHQTLWQVEQNKYCQKVLKKHWPQSKIYDDVRNIRKDNVAPVDVIMAGFPCQDISCSGLQRGIYEGKKSSLWWEVWRIARDLRPRVLVLENVANILRLGGSDVVGSLAEIGYDAEWSIVSARERGSCHLRERWFCVAYPGSERCLERQRLEKKIQQKRHKGLQREESKKSNLSESTYSSNNASHSHGERCKKRFRTGAIKEKNQHHKIDLVRKSKTSNYWKRHEAPSPICRVDDGVSNRVDRIRALGNAIVPQCSQYVFECIIKSGLLS